ncbi:MULTISPECIES: transposase [Acidiphilium]
MSARKIPFILRLRENQHVVREGFETWTIAGIAQRLGKGQKMILKGWCRLGQGAGEGSPRLRIVVMRLPTNELLALACSSKPHHALAGYRQRWTIETMFANLKTKGFNLEDTHITDPGKLSTLLAVLPSAGFPASCACRNLGQLRPERDDLRQNRRRGRSAPSQSRNMAAELGRSLRSASARSIK